ncbi:MAG: hypothetical protein K2H29_12645, partial [Oscillospiraceae bacterium]|nr:hypothetical protein [Oscillospiraceae bacterium]
EYERPATGESWVRSATTLKSDRKLTPTARDIYDVLLDMCTEANNIIRISLNSLKRKAFCCRKSVTNALNRLEKCGYINKLPKAWETETNTFFVFKILPDKKRRSSAKAAKQFENNLEIQMPETSEILRAKPEKVRKPRKKKPEQSNKKRYGNYSLVALTDKEYNNLLNDFGKQTVETYIQIADMYSQKHNRKKPYDNNAEVIRKWIEQDRQNGRPWKSKSYSYPSKNNTMPKEELESYLRLGMRFIEEETTSEPEIKPVFNPEPKPDLKPESESDPKPVPESKPCTPVTEKYQMTDEEIALLLDCWDTDKVYDTYYRDKSHPLCHCSVGELMEMAKRQREQRDTS